MAVSPSQATSVSYPSRFKSSLRASAMLGSSSTIKIRFSFMRSLRLDWKQYGESTSAARLTFQFQASTVGAHDLRRHRESESRSLDVQLLCSRTADELSEDLALLRPGNAGPLVFHRNSCQPLRGFYGDPNRRVFRRILDGVVDEVAKRQIQCIMVPE